MQGQSLNPVSLAKRRTLSLFTRRRPSKVTIADMLSVTHSSGTPP